ncbi:hypothetical protein GH714_006050 [Hevea brasiliensis]|uniref:Phytanoyl-CoA dioxygenase n=1 Tax=Hevea brasiliensis TaxID=3981 RepID=A0A6A6LYB8_HEVBR|nr:hypothetical protein GH714_006050 [Hevea brasiliensis]
MGINGNLTSEQLQFFNSQEKAFGEDGNLQQPKQLSINKVGHALHELDPVFKKFLSYSSYCINPNLIQTFHGRIHNQPGIGGEVVPQQDNSFLYTEQTTCTGLWLALEDATIRIPDLIKNYPIELLSLVTSPFVVFSDGLIRRFLTSGQGMYFDRPFPSYDQKDFVPIEVKTGSLVVIHGDLIHQSFENHSSKSGHAYSLHVVDTDGCNWAPDNCYAAI